MDSGQTTVAVPVTALGPGARVLADVHNTTISTICPQWKSGKNARGTAVDGPIHYRLHYFAGTRHIHTTKTLRSGKRDEEAKYSSSGGVTRGIEISPPPAFVLVVFNH
ncbi:hypothetical protein GCK32_020368 [Trichostrongylus colubriformis]|uniref:Uncharacterized protein n=1 Tax=Trichostrongylus colubriformis TaxID=6319 RepID=A0AAN8FW37_TRICO